MSNQWTFQTGAPADPNRTLPVFSFLPNWKNGVTETLSWLTEVFSSELGAEQRRPLRRFPRRTFEAGFLREGADRTRLDLFLAGTGKKPFLLPLWHEQFTLDSAYWNTNGTIQFPSQSLEAREFRADQLVMITTGDPKHYAILYCDGVNIATDQIHLLGFEDSIGAWPQGSRIIPLRRARVLAEMKMENPTDRAGVSQIRFQLTDVDTYVSPSWGPQRATWPFKVNREDTVDVSYFRSDFVLDFDSGVITVADPGNQVQVVQGANLRFFGRAATYAFRQFLYKAKGRLKGFGMSSHSLDLFLRANIESGDTIDTEVSGFYEYVKEPQDARAVIRITFKDGRLPQYRTITNVEPILDSVPPFRQVGERFTLDSVLSPALKSQVAEICFYTFVRLDQDVIELEHATADCRAVSSKIVTRSVAQFESVAGDWPPTGAGPGATPLAPAPPPPLVIPPEPMEPSAIPWLIKRYLTQVVDSRANPVNGSSDVSYGFFIGVFDNNTNQGTYVEQYRTAFALNMPVIPPNSSSAGAGSVFITEYIENGNPPQIGTAECTARSHRLVESWVAGPGPNDAPDSGVLFHKVYSDTVTNDWSFEVNDFNFVNGARYFEYVDARNYWVLTAHPQWVALRNSLTIQYNAAYAQYLIDKAAWEAEYGE